MMLVKIICLIAGFAGMEYVSHVMHKYVMHGFLWSLHRSHHQKSRGFLEKNDLYFLIFATPGVLLIISGVQAGFSWRFFLGLGIALYGLTYLIIHDILIHQRLRWMLKYEGRYIKALRRAHKSHHAHTDKNAAVSYGLLWVDRRYFQPADKAEKVQPKNVIL